FGERRGHRARAHLHAPATGARRARSLSRQIARGEPLGAPPDGARYRSPSSETRAASTGARSPQRQPEKEGDCMTPKPTGHVRGNDLILTRTFRASIDDVWTSVTARDSTARRIGRWEGEAGPGNTVRLQMVQEKGQPWPNVRIERCGPPR